jgi:hypothetical protein
MLKEMAAEKGIDLDAIELEDDDDFERRFDDPSVVHLITHMANAYISMVDDWFDMSIYLKTIIPNYWMRPPILTKLRRMMIPLR